MRTLPIQGGMLETVVRALAKSDLFGALREDQLRKIAQRAELLQCAPGETLLAAGDASEAFYVVLNGEAVVTSTGDLEVGRIGPEGVVGEMGVLLGTPRTASVHAEGPALLLRFDAAVFDALFERVPGFGLAISRALARRLASVNDRVRP